LNRSQQSFSFYQTPGAAESMQKTACTRMVGFPAGLIKKVG
jgi:hypothetical protein